MDSEKLVKIIDMSCGRHNCCKVDIETWAEKLGVSELKCKAVLVGLFDERRINIKDGMVFKTVDFWLPNWRVNV